MFSTSILDSLVTFGYLAAALGLGCCIIGYFALPKLIKSAFEDEDKNEDSQN